ncbi:MAG: CRISPR-associated endonuclease Cas1 [Bacteroidota bacterium]|jgi:CRISPR-associated protein Cas1
MDLYLHTFAAKLRARNGMLEVHTYFNDGDAAGLMPSAVGKKGSEAASSSLRRYEYSPHAVECVWLQQGSSVSTDAVVLAMQHNIDLLFLDAFGHPVARVWRTAPCSNAAIQRQQLAAAQDSRAVVHVKNWVVRKLENQVHLLETFMEQAEKSGKKSKAMANGLPLRAVLRIKSLREKVTILQGEHIDDIAESLRGYEGAASRYYFEALSSLLPKQHRFSTRSQHPANDAFNAFLNYAYGILYAEVERALLLAGLNPYLGFLHRDGYQYAAMVYDFIEPYRVWADYAVFRLFNTTEIDASQHLSSMQEGGGVWLNDAGKRLLSASFLPFLKDIPKNRRQTLLREARSFAQAL